MKKVLITLALLLAFVSSGYGQGTGPITVKEADGSPSYTGIRTFIFDNGTVTISGNTARVLNTGGSGGSGTVTTFSCVNANGVSCSVANATTTPAATFTLGAITPTSVNGLTISTVTAGTFTLTNSKTFTVSNTLTLAGTDGSTLNVGAGGTLGSAAFTAASAYEVPLTFSTGLSRSTNTITVDQSFAPTWSGAHIHTSTIALTSTTAANNKITQGAALNLGTTNATGIELQNTTAAAAGAQQWSPCLTLTSQGWKTNSTAASQSTNWCIQNQSVQGAASPTTNLVFSSQVNGGGYTGRVSMLSSGNLSLSALGYTNWVIDTNSISQVITFSANGVASAGGFDVNGVKTAQVSFASTQSASSDGFIRRLGALSLGISAADSATPGANTLTIGDSSRGGTDSNVTGANGILRPGNGTGTGGSGAFKIQVAPVDSTGAVANTYSDALSISNAKVATFSGDIQGVTATFSGAINVASCTGCGGGGTTINASGQGIWIPDVIYDADNFEGVATGNDVKFYRFYNPFAITADRADYKGVVAQASGKFSFSLRSWDCTTTTYFDSGVVDTTSWSNVDVTTTLSSATLPAGGICLMWTHDNTTSKTRVVGPQGNTMAVWNIAPTGAKRAGTCANTSTAGVLPSSCGTQTASNTQGIFQFTLRKN